MRRSLVVGIGAAAAGSLALAPPAGAATRARADAIALRALGTRDLAGMVALFGDPSPLAAGDVVGAWSLTSGSSRMPTVRLSSPAWLFWEDEVYGADLAHPSRLLLIDANTGRVLADRKLDMVPLVNGAEPPFAPGKSGYASRKYLVYSTVTPSSASALAVRPDAFSGGPFAHAAATGPITPDDLKGQCLVTIGDRGPGPGNNLGDPRFKADFKAIGDWADSIKLNRLKSPSTYDGLKETIYTLLLQGCRDFMIYVAGHGRAPKPERVGGVKVHYGPFAPEDESAGSGEPGIVLTANRPEGAAPDAQPDVTYLTPTEISNIVDLFSTPGDITIGGETKTLTAAQVQGVKFKLKLDSCYSGWFANYLLFIRNITPGQPKPGSALALVESSSSSTELSFFHLSDAFVLENGREVKKTSTTTNPHGLSEATNGNIAGLTSWAQNPTMGRTLEAGIQQAFTDGAGQDFARTIGYTHPQVLGPDINLGTPDPSTKDTTFVHKKLPKGGKGGPPGKPIVFVSTTSQGPAPPDCNIYTTFQLTFQSGGDAYDGQTAVLDVFGPGAPGDMSTTITGGQATWMTTEPPSDTGWTWMGGGVCVGGNESATWQAKLVSVGPYTYP